MNCCANAEEWQKMRVIRAVKMVRRALHRRDQAAVDSWMTQFKIEVERLSAIRKEEGK